MRVYDKPIELLKLDEQTERFVSWDKCPKRLHAHINRKRDRGEYQSGETTQHRQELVFEVRWNRLLKEIFELPQRFRIRFDGIDYDITDTDDYMLEHRTLKMTGVSVHGRH